LVVGQGVFTNVQILATQLTKVTDIDATEGKYRFGLDSAKDEVCRGVRSVMDDSPGVFVIMHEEQ